jgi:hypothetical protein
LSQMPSESSELYEAMRSYTAAALQLVSKQCPERPPYLMPSPDNWKRVSDHRFQVYDESIPYWVGCILSNRDALHNLDEYQRVLAILRGTPDIAAQMDQVVRAGVEITTLEAHRIADRLIWSLAERTGGLHFDEQVFNEQFHQLITDLRRSEFSFILLVPLFGVTAESLPIVLEPHVEIDRMTDEEVVRCLTVGLLPDPHDRPSSSHMATVRSDIAVRVRYYLPKRVGENSEVTPNPIVSGARDLATNVLYALRVFKEGRISIPGMLNVNLPMEWPLPHATESIPANPGLSLWVNTYALSKDEAKGFQLFWTHFRRAMSTAVLANAVRRFSYACERDRPDDWLVDLMIAAESLFLGGESGPANRGELSYRLSLRAAFFIDSQDYSRREVFNHMRRAYDNRSAIVHGGGEPRPQDLRAPNNDPISLYDFSELTAGLLRMALQKGINVASGANGPLLDWNALIIPP